MRIANNNVKGPRLHQAVRGSLMIAVLMLSAGAAYAQSGNPCLDALGKADCDSPHRPAPILVNELWNAIAFSPSHTVAAFAGSFTAPENAKAAALKGCSARARDCRIIVAAHDSCLAVAYERSAGGAFRWASGASKQDAEGKALTVCMAEGPQRCAVLARCSGTPPVVFVNKK